MVNDLQYKLVENEAELHGAYEVRRQVFVVEQGIPEDLVYEGEDDADKINVVVEDGGGVIGTARVALVDNRAKIERMAVLKSWRSRGVGKGIVDFIVIDIKSRGIEEVFLHAQRGAVGFYKSCGFIETGAPFSEAGIEHVRMEIRL